MTSRRIAAPLAPADRMDRRLLSRRRSASVLRMALPSSGALEGARAITEYRATGRVPERLTPQREQALERIGERQGLVSELAIDRRRLRRRDPRPRQGGRDRGGRGGDRRPLSGARSGPRPARAGGDAGRRGGGIARSGRGGRLRALAARRRHRLGQDRSLFRGDRAGDPAATGRRSSCCPRSP